MTILTDSTGAALPLLETPGPDTLRAYGEALFLALRSPRHAGMTLGTLRQYLEPPLALGQYRIFRVDGVPRGMVTWARFSPLAEQRFVLGEPLTLEDWCSGDALWVADILAPYRGVAAGIARHLRRPGNFCNTEFFFRRVSGDNRTRRIVHVSCRPGERSGVVDVNAFLAQRAPASPAPVSDA